MRVTILSEFEKTINLLKNLNPLKESLDLSSSGELKKINRSVFRNFFSWLIHRITCGRVLRNATLDKITNQMLLSFDVFSKDFLEKKDRKTGLTEAFKNLKKICMKNGGSKLKEVEQRLVIVNEIAEGRFGNIEQISNKRLLELASQTRSENQKDICAAIEKKITPDSPLISDNHAIISSLFPHFSPEYQCKLVLQRREYSFFIDVLFSKDDPIKSEKLKIWIPIIENILNELSLTKEFVRKKSLVFNQLLPKLNENTQAKLLSIIFPALRNDFRSIYSLPPNVWELASRQIPAKISDLDILPCTPEQKAAFINGRTSNNFDFDTFFRSYFFDVSEESGKIFLAHIKPDFFKHLSGSIYKKAWTNLFFLLAFSPLDKKHQENFLAAFERILQLKEHSKGIEKHIQSILDKLELQLDLEKYSNPIKLILLVLLHAKNPIHRNSILKIANQMSEEEIVCFSAYFQNSKFSSVDDKLTEEQIKFLCDFLNLLENSKFDIKFVEIFVDQVFKWIPRNSRLIVYRHLPKVAWKSVLAQDHYLDEETCFHLPSWMPQQLAIKFIDKNSWQIQNYSKKYSTDLKEHRSRLYELSYDASFLYDLITLLRPDEQLDAVKHLNLFPWKLLLSSVYSLQPWLRSKYLSQFPNLPENLPNNFYLNLGYFLENAQGEDLRDIFTRYQGIPGPVKELFLVPTKQTITDLNYCLNCMSFGQFLVILMDPQANQVLIDAIQSEKIDVSTIDFAGFVNFAQKVHEKFKAVVGVDVSLIKKFLDTRISKRPDMLNDPFTDFEFQLGSEKIRVHKALLSLVPDLQEYLKQASPIVVSEEADIEMIKSLINSAYMDYTVVEMPSKRLEIKSNSLKSSLFNNSEAFSDIIITDGETKTKIALHRTILYHSIPYFRRALESFKESTQKEIIFHTDDPHFEITFDAIQTVIGYHYGVIDKDQIEDESKPFFERAIDYLS